MLPLVLADFVDGNDIRVLKIGRSFRLGAKPLASRGRRPLTRENHFQRDEPVQAQLSCFVDDSHAAVGDFFEDLVVAEQASWRFLRRPAGFIDSRRQGGCVPCPDRLAVLLRRTLLVRKLTAGANRSRRIGRQLGAAFAAPPC